MSSEHPGNIEVPTNKVGASSVEELVAVERYAAAKRIAELDSDTYLDRDDHDPGLSPDVLTALQERRFDADHLRAIHAYILQDVYDWGGRLREPGETTMAMGIDHAPPEVMRAVLPLLESDIALDRPDLDTPRREALETAADHWSQMTYLHPFPDGNSRSQRVFFTEYLRDAGWDLDWNKIDAGAVHAARHVSLIFTDPTYLAAQLEPGLVGFGDPDATGSLTALTRIEYDRSPEYIGDLYEQMISYAEQAQIAAEQETSDAEQDDNAPRMDGYAFAADHRAVAQTSTTSAAVAAAAGPLSTGPTSSKKSSRTSSTKKRQQQQQDRPVSRRIHSSGPDRGTGRSR